MSLYEEWSRISVAFVEALKTHMPELLQQKTHLILHLVDCMRELGPSSAFSAERFESFKSNSLRRTADEKEEELKKVKSQIMTLPSFL
ncbi:hypothetical protein EMCRGX_G028267 [Ephydatia muelleri]